MDQEDTKNRMYVALGMMSGTSMDGIDIALLRTNGKYRLERGPFASFPYTEKFRRKLEAGLKTARSIVDRSARPGDLKKLERDITDRHGKAIGRFLEKTGLRLSDIDIVGFHGQTVLHRPERALTVQLGDGQQLARAVGLPVVYDLRANDMAHGGQGAPLACAYHRSLARNLSIETGWPVAFVNLGGIANITWISRDGEVRAFDAGPGNMLLDMWMERKAGRSFDNNGETAASGRVNDKILREYLCNSFFDRSAPKSLDRGDFKPLKDRKISLEDGARTLARLTAEAVVGAVDHLPAPPSLWIISGGGAKNPVILSDILELAKTRSGGQSRVESATAIGLNSDAVEAEAWAYLAVRSIRGLKITWPGTTGVRSAVSGGKLAKPDRL